MTKNLLYKSETINNQQILTNKNAMSFKSLKKVLLHPNVTLSYIKNHPRALSRAIKLTVYSRFPIGTNIFERDWDVMIVLDACRVDSMEAVVNEYAFLPSTVSKITSRASSTIEWVSQTFTTEYEDEISKTVYVSANPWPERILSGEESTEGYYSAGFAPTKWDTVTPDTFQEFYTILPEGDQRHRHVGEKKLSAEEITNYAIETARTTEWSQLLIHYLQPHSPYRAKADSEGRNELREWENEPWEFLTAGGERSLVKEAYMDELRAGLDGVEQLLKNMNADKVVITADHGEAFGRRYNGHPPASIHPSVRRVPWIETSASDERTIEPEVELPQSQTGSAVRNQLQALGYI